MADILARTRSIIGTSAEWNTSDLVLGDGEVAIERPSSPSTAPRFKIGNGARRYSELPFAGANLPGAIYYKGTRDLTQPAPPGPQRGDQWASSVSGTIHASWTGVAGESTIVGDLVTFLDNVTGWQRTPTGADSVYGLRQELVTNFAGNIRAQGFRTGNWLWAPGPGSALFYALETITEHAHYAFADDSTVNYAGVGFQGHASFNDNIKFIGVNGSDHHHSYQSYPHYGTAGTIGVLSSFWSQIDATAGTITEASGVKVNNPLGAGAITSMYGALILNLTRGANNWGVKSLTPRSYFAEILQYGDTVGTVYATAGYNATNGHFQITPRAGAAYGVRISGNAGSRALRLGSVGDVASDDSIIEQLGDGRTSIKPRVGYGIILDGTVEVSGGLVMSAPIVRRSYTVATLPSAVSWINGTAMVSDANATVFNSVPVGGGANKLPVFSNGADWRIG